MRDLKLTNVKTITNDNDTFDIALEYLFDDGQKCISEYYRIIPIFSEEQIDKKTKVTYLKLLPIDEKRSFMNTYNC